MRVQFFLRRGSQDSVNFRQNTKNKRRTKNNKTKTHPTNHDTRA